jgi:hypothetical protein
MATAVAEPINAHPQINNLTLAKPAPIVPLKIGEFGGQGSGKSSTAALIAAAISVQHCNRAPVFVVDPELAWPFLKPLIFDAEGIQLIHKPYRSFKQMHDSIREAEREGACVWIVDPLTLHWSELLETYKKRNGFIPIDAWGDIRDVWNSYINDFLNTKMTCIAAGRLGNDFEEQEKTMANGGTKTELVKVGTKFKAGGGESFGYEPHLLFELSLERKSKKVRGQEREGEGRMVHRVDVLKDRTWALNGQTIRWPDRPGYQKGDFKHVWTSIKPHFTKVQAVGGHQVVGDDTSAALIQSDSSRSEFYEKRQRKEVLSAELHATMDMLWGGTAQAAKQMRMKVFEHVFGFKSKEAADAASLDKIERGVRILQAFEKRCKTNPNLLGSGELDILANLDIDIREFDEGKAEESDLPF